MRSASPPRPSMNSWTSLSIEELKTQLERRIAELSEEIRNYPTPIARCDEQLPALLEERSKLIQELKNLNTCSPLAVWANDGGFHAT
jgi:hypothetical protein